MSTGTKRNNMTIGAGTSFQDKYSLTAAKSADLRVLKLQDEKGNLVMAWYEGSTAITLSNYADFEPGSIIFDRQAKKTYHKTGAVGTSTWYYDAWTVVS